ncbi:MAG: hypothetical protein C0599_08505 [Salinivirgaceae bacterium]|nr:MAG: hypothetical protein C0599_08505 [Salinivirgaceae bacterium]
MFKQYLIIIFVINRTSIFVNMYKTIIISLALLYSVVGYGQKLQETRNFNTPKEVVVDGKMTIKFHKSEDVDIVIETDKVKLEDVYTKYENNKLLIRVEPLDIEDGKVSIDAYLPSFENLTLHRGAKTRISQKMFTNDVTLTATTGADIRAQVQNNKTTIKATSGSFIQLEGKTNKLEAIVHSGAKVRTDSLDLKFAKIKCRTGGFIAVTPTIEANIKSTLGGTVKLLKKVNVISKNTLFGKIERDAQ